MRFRVAANESAESLHHECTLFGRERFERVAFFMIAGETHIMPMIRVLGMFPLPE